MFFPLCFRGQTGQASPQPGAFSICNADKMEIPGRICKSSAGVIGFVAADDESDPIPSDGRVIFRVFVFPGVDIFLRTPRRMQLRTGDSERDEWRLVRRGLDCFHAEPCDLFLDTEDMS